MRTISSDHPKGKEPARTLADDLGTLGYILRMAWGYWVDGNRIRRLFRERQQQKRKLYLEEL